ncbi:MAG: peptidoglycan-binding protein [Sterolibacteriaceae bacterium]|nr:peptidoglycan-binding protein [Sterolibacteriaceae bacterium]MBK9086847.1 peptidoglycan-binding protein [Sterolibacteriaceae bacterium]
MLVRANTGNACITYRFEGGQSALTIDKSVGQGGFNHKGDVQTIQRLLNLIEVSDGGPMVTLAEDGLVGPKTIGAIRGFQQFHHTGSDGRVDPNGPTLKKMNEVPKNRLAQQNASRLARTAQAMPDLVAMARKAQRTAEAAMDFLRLGIGSSKRAHELADLHFAFGRQAQGATIAELAFIRTTFVRAAGVLVSRASPLTGGNPFGVSIYTIDPLGRDWMAYSPMQLGDDNRDIPEVHSGHVYLCNRLDSGVVPDLFTHILFHELIHFVDDESKERRIVDHGYREMAMKLPHSLRMHNSDNYALFASHIHFGRDRLIASQPSLRPHIPANL